MLQDPSPGCHVPPDIRVEHAKLPDHPQRRIRIQPDQRQHLYHGHLPERVQCSAQSAHTTRISTADRRVANVPRVCRGHTRLLLHRGAHHFSSTTPQTHRPKIAPRLSPPIHWLFRTEIWRGSVGKAVAAVERFRATSYVGRSVGSCKDCEGALVKSSQFQGADFPSGLVLTGLTKLSGLAAIFWRSCACSPGS